MFTMPTDSNPSPEQELQEAYTQYQREQKSATGSPEAAELHGQRAHLQEEFRPLSRTRGNPCAPILLGLLLLAAAGVLIYLLMR